MDRYPLVLRLVSMGYHVTFKRIGKQTLRVTIKRPSDKYFMQMDNPPGDWLPTIVEILAAHDQEAA